jgi:phosphoribosylanthranilate isomerase/ribosomal protein S18 acetylase RimI-like enzyme
MIVKICGLTNFEDSLAAAELGADYLGFNFYPKSPRCIAETDCGKIVASLRVGFPDLTYTGVFVNHPMADIIRIVKRCGLDAAQLSGGEPPEALAALATEKIRGFKAVRSATDDRMLEEYAVYAAGEPALLLDATAPLLYGGTGRTADWDWAAGITSRHPVFLAGGLTAENVGEAIQTAKPWGVDAASGIESSAGKKDRQRMGAFIAAARREAAGTQIRIEPAQAGDAPEILALQRLAYRSEAALNGDFTISPLTQTLPEIESEFGGKVFLRAKLDGRIIGSVRAEQRGGSCHIGRLIVHPELQNRGTGSRLLREIEARFPQARRFELFTSARSARNLHLYQKSGYRIFKVEPLNENVTLIYLEKPAEGR